jgi:tetraacyldisaccharide-1-P 4'-kinase
VPPLSAVFASALAGAGRVVRPLALPRPTVAIGGATLGGSGKTPVAIACAAELARAGRRTALIGHAYRAAPGRPRFVSPDDALDEVGDEALVAARALDAMGALGARVAVAPGRAAAIAFAAPGSDVLVLDGVGQTRPLRASLALLAVDADAPWGLSPPLHLLASVRRGALGQSPRATLLSACDAIVALIDGVEGGEASAGPGAGAAADAREQALERLRGLGRPVWPAVVSSRGAWVGQELLTWEVLRSRRVGLVTALARPERVSRSLERRGIVPRVVVSARDHGPLGPLAALRAKAITSARELDIWVATSKCELHAARALPPWPPGVPLARLDYTVTLAPELQVQLRALPSSSGVPRAP